MGKLRNFLEAISFIVLVTFCFFVPALAQDMSFSLSPAEAWVQGILPGQTKEVSLTVQNNMDIPVSFFYEVYNPSERERREEYNGLPDKNWISFQPPEIKISPHSSGVVKAKIIIPRDERWQEQNYECWMRVSSEKVGLFQFQLNARLYILTGTGFASVTETPVINWQLIGWIIAGIIIVIWVIGVILAKNKRRVLH